MLPTRCDRMANVIRRRQLSRRLRGELPIRDGLGSYPPAPSGVARIPPSLTAQAPWDPEQM
jgi:hypothetical protein